MVDNNKLISNVNCFMFNFSLSYKLVEGLNLNNCFGVDVYFDCCFYCEVIGIIGIFLIGCIYEDNINNCQFNNDIILIYIKQLNDINLDFMVGNQINDCVVDCIFIQGVNLVVLDFFDLLNVVIIIINQNNSQCCLIGVYVLVMVGYKSFLYLMVIGCNDWLSILLKDSCSYFYFSVFGSFVFIDVFEGL